MKSILPSLALALVLASAGAAAAQSVSAGIKGGVAFSDIPKYSADLDDAGATNLRYRIGGIGGGFLTVHFDNHFDNRLAFQVEGLYTQKGMHAEDPLGNAFEIRVDYVEIPLLLRLQASRARGAYLLVGPSINVNVRSKFFVEGQGEDDAKESVESTEMALVLAGGYQGRYVLVEGRWAEGLTNIAKDADESYKTRTFAVLVGVRFK
jgi:hypothetical protein